MDRPSPFDGLTDDQVLARALAALKRVHATESGTFDRLIAWAPYEQAKAELDMRLYQHTLKKIQEGREP